MIYVVNVDIEVEANNPTTAENDVLDFLDNMNDAVVAVRGVEAIA